MDRNTVVSTDRCGVRPRRRRTFTSTTVSTTTMTTSNSVLPLRTNSPTEPVNESVHKHNYYPPIHQHRRRQHDRPLTVQRSTPTSSRIYKSTKTKTTTTTTAFRMKIRCQYAARRSLLVIMMTMSIMSSLLRTRTAITSHTSSSLSVAAAAAAAPSGVANPDDDVVDARNSEVGELVSDDGTTMTSTTTETITSMSDVRTTTTITIGRDELAAALAHEIRNADGGSELPLQLDRLLSQHLAAAGGKDPTATDPTTGAHTVATASVSNADSNNNSENDNNNLFNSIWKQFKQTFENTVSSRLHHHQHHYHQQTDAVRQQLQDQQQYHQHHRHPNTKSNVALEQNLRRWNLFEKSVDQHYMQRYLDSLPSGLRNEFERWVKQRAIGQPQEDAKHGRPPNTATTPASKLHQQQKQKQQYGSNGERLQPYRWKVLLSEGEESSSRTVNATIGENDETSSQMKVTERRVSSSWCYHYWENRNSFWSFRWCPGTGEIVQGQSNIVDSNSESHQDPSFTRKYSLGSWVGPESETDMNKLHQTYPDDVRFWLVMREIYRKRTTEASRTSTPPRVDLYIGGDRCFEEHDTTTPESSHFQGKKNQKRMSVVVYHDFMDDICTMSLDAVTADSLVVMERVDEPHQCRYVVHVCSSSEISTGADRQIDEMDEQSPKKMRNVVTESDLQHLNETYSALQHKVLQLFLRQSHADAQHHKSPTILTSLGIGLPPMPQSIIESNKQLVQEMFQHAYDNYMYNAFPASEIKPISCGPAQFNLVKIPALTLIDSLDTLVVLGNFTEFARSVERVRYLNDQIAEDAAASILVGVERVESAGLFSLDKNVSVFETNIRILGGLLSAHQLAEAFMNQKVLESEVWADQDKKLILDGRLKKEDKFSSAVNQNNNTASVLHWKYDGFLLQLSQNIGDRLIQAFDTNTGIPYGTVNLLTGVPEGETPVASLAGGGTLSLEMELLSRLTGNANYGRSAKLATRALWMRRSSQGLLGKHISSRTGAWTETLSGIGSNSDSFYEYLIKYHVLFPEDSDFWLQMIAAHSGVFNESRTGEWYGDVDMNRGQQNGGGLRQVFESLMAFYPGLEVLLGEITPAARTLNSFFLVREYLGFLPERFNFGNWRVDMNGGQHLLRPELLESAYFLHRSSFDFQRRQSGEHIQDSETSGWQWAADFALHALEQQTRVNCGYASIRDVSPFTTGSLDDSQHKQMKLLDEMPSYFLSETLKYLYLIFDEENMLHTDENREWVFTTEAHPIHYQKMKNEDHSPSKLSLLQQQKIELEGRLRMRLNGYSARSNPAAIDADKLQQRELWSVLTSYQEYRNELKPIEWDDSRFFESRKSYIPVEPFIRYHSTTIDLDVLNERTFQFNPAHKSFRVIGSGPNLSRSCENLYASDLLWYRALNGGSSDYTSSYMSRIHDTVSLTEGQALLLGSIDAMALYGSGVHIETLFDESLGCATRSRHKTQSIQTATKRHHASKDQRDSAPVYQIDMGGGMGNFEVSPFPGGGGFSIQHINSGESMVTTLIDGNDLDSYILVYASQGDSQEEETPIGDMDDSRIAVMADLKGNTFVCRVELLLSGINSSSLKPEEHVCMNDSVENDQTSFLDNSAEIIAIYPCSMGLFGATSPSRLDQFENLSVVAPIISAESNYGCPTSQTDASTPNSSEDEWLESDDEIEERISTEGVCEQKVVSVIHRGVCTFEEKAMSQKLESGASAVIVINSAEEELFVMAGSATNTDVGNESDQYPPTVLVSGNDGQSILDMIEESGEYENVQLLARVSVFRENTVVVESNGIVAAVGNTVWPGVRASPESLQIFSENGWGVHAVQTQTGRNEASSASSSSTTPSSQVEWQLFLMRHDMGSRTAG